MLHTTMLVIILLFCSEHTSWAFLGIGEVTISWKEEVTLQSGQVLSVERAVTNGPDEWWRKGRGKIEKQTLSFSNNGHHIKWKADGNDWPFSAMPLVLELINEEPVIVMPVYNMGPCSKYDFPQEGIVAFRFHDRRWSRLSIGELPLDLKINLLQGTHGILSSANYKDKIIDADAKHKLERFNTKEYKQGVLISDSIKHLSDISDSCARIHPLPNQALEATKQRIRDAERNARTVIATAGSSVTVPENISSKDFNKAKGIWTGNGYLSTTCKGIIKKIEPLLKYYNSSGGRSTIGAQLILTNGNKLPIEYSQEKTQNRDRLDLTTCDETTIYTIRRQSKNRLLIQRFRHSGEVADSLFLILPETEITKNDQRWPTIWEVTTKNDFLTIILADYTYEQTANQGGTLHQKQHYSAKLPR